MVLVYVYDWGDEASCGTDYFVFDYESKEKFIFDVLEKFKDKEWKVYGSKEQYHEKAQLFSNSDSVHLDRFDIESIEYSIFTVEEWVAQKKEELRV